MSTEVPNSLGTEKPLSSWERFLFILSRGPRIIQIIRELIAVFSGSAAEVDQYLTQLDQAIQRMKSKTPEERQHARAQLSDLISRL